MIEIAIPTASATEAEGAVEAGIVVFDHFDRTETWC